jgi:ABC-type transporter Mla subunit MlaD
MPEAGEIKAKVIIEYDGSGVKQAKEDLASLAESAGTVGESAGQASEGLSGLDEQMGRSADSTKSFSSALESLPKIAESGTSGFSSMNNVLSEHQSAIEETGSAYEALQSPIESTVSLLQEASPSMESFSKSTESMMASIGTTSDIWGTAGNNIQAFQEALASPDSFQMIDAHLDKTGQSYGQFANSLSEGNQQILHEMSTDWAQTSSWIDDAGKSFVDAGKSAHEGFGSIAVSAGEADAAVAAFLGTGEKAGKTAGDWWSGQSRCSVAAVLWGY